MFKEIHFPSIHSTHLYAIEHINEYLDNYIYLSADHQTDGIGRKGDAWVATGENLLGTFIFPLPEKDGSNLAQLLAFSAIKLLEKWALEPSFKWPNDILLSHKKVAGVMADIKDSTAIISIGMNVNMTKEDLDTINIPATSLQEELRHPLSLPLLKKNLLLQFANDLTIFQKSGFEPFFVPLATKLAFLGKIAKAGDFQGKIKGLNPDGRLILQTSDVTTLISDSSLVIVE